MDECTEFIGLGDCPYCEIERLKEENDRYRMALERIAIFSEYESAWQGCMRMQDVAREALEEVQGE